MRKRVSSGTHKARTMCCYSYFVAPSELETSTCMVSMQCGDEDEMCMVCQAAYPPQVNCKLVIEALVLANNAHEEKWAPMR